MKHLGEEFQKPYMRRISDFLKKERLKELQEGEMHICPRPESIFRAFRETPFESVKTVVLGQDPYHGPRQAMGLCFSVPTGIPFPPSLRNIFIELKEDVGISWPASGDLTPWARQGVMLLNSVLTTAPSKAGMHSRIGWQDFTDKTISVLNEGREGLIFLLWGVYAQEKRRLIDEKRHHILTAAHPSPLSAYRGFFGCRHFSKTNAILRGAGLESINWQLPSA